MWNGSPASQVNWITWWTRSVCCESCHTAPAEKMKESSTMPGQMRLMSNLSGEWHDGRGHVVTVIVRACVLVLVDARDACAWPCPCS